MEESTSLFNVLLKGGWMIIPIFIASLVALAISIERWITLRRARIDTESFIQEIKEIVRKGGIYEAIHRCARTPGPIAAIVKAGLEKREKSYTEIKDSIESAGRAEIYILERNLGILATIASVAPLLGFTGTVLGMIKAFMQIESLGGNVNASVLAGGIWEALVTTVAGLIVGIVTLIVYNYLVDRVQRFVFEMEVSSQGLIKVLPTREEKNEF
ncbi:MAG: hypothetical protein B6244_00920 [Candidatus Cloacimonetes bacterium 4572_55]|nr:MAG: hypothetical protein B6244_00920 [Candidatus Cloacimonetes bacterium 4572_55]